MNIDKYQNQKYNIYNKNIQKIFLNVNLKLILLFYIVDEINKNISV